jgi:hypothetical protein
MLMFPFANESFMSNNDLSVQSLQSKYLCNYCYNVIANAVA